MSGGEWCCAIGVVADSTGIVQWQSDEVHRAIGPGGREFVSVTRHTTSALEPASRYASCQPSEIPAKWRHRDALGTVILLVRSGGFLSAVAVLPTSASFFTDGMPPLYWSSGTRDDDDGQLTIREISLTPSPATSALTAVEFHDGPPHLAKGRSGAPWSLLNRADEIIRAAHGVEYARCQFDDRDAPPRRPVGESRGRVMHNGEELEMLYRPARIISVK